MQRPIRTNQQREVGRPIACARPGDIKDFLGISKESIHRCFLSNTALRFPEDSTILLPGAAV
jgi:hypothetical protein